jgi:peptide/nickel transport system substrate-binding protein
VHAIDDLPEGQIPVIQGNNALKLLTSQTGGLRALHMHCGQKPWTDVRARQALMLGLDREQLLSQALSGHGQVAYDIPGRFTDAAYPQGYTKQRDVEKAKALLKASGLGDTPITLTEADAASGLLAAAQLVPAQLKEVGFNIELHKVDANTLYGDRYGKWQFMGDWWGAKPYLLQVQQALLPGSPLNMTHWDDKEFFGLLDDALRTVDPAKQQQIVRDMMMIEGTRGGTAVWAFPETTDAYSSKITGFVPHVGGLPLSNFQLKDVSFV